MRKYGKVSPRIWTGRLGRMMHGRPEMQVLVLYLVTNQHQNLVGIHRLPIPYVTTDTGLPDRVISGLFKELEEFGFLRYDLDTMTVWVIDHVRHEMGGKVSPQQAVAISRVLEEFNSSYLVLEFAKMYPQYLPEGFDVDTLSIPCPSPSPSPSPSPEQEPSPDQTKAAEPAEPASAQKSDKVGPKSTAAEKAAESKRLLSDLEATVSGFKEAFEGWRAAGGSKWTAWAVILKLRAFQEIASRRPKDVLDMLAVAARRSWQGFEETWYDKDRGSNGYGKPLPRERRFQPRDTETKYPQPEIFE